VTQNNLKEEIRGVLQKKLVDLVGFTTVPTKQKYPPIDVLEAKTPHDVMPNAKSVIVYGKALLESERDVWAVFSSREGDSFGAFYGRLIDAGYSLILLLKSKGYEAQHYRAHYLKFFASKAGLGCLGKNRLVITPQFGPRIRLWGVLTDAVLEPDEAFTEDLCINCSKCLTACPVQALTEHGFNRKRCWDNVFSNLKWMKPGIYTWCSACLDACPVGATG